MSLPINADIPSISEVDVNIGTAFIKGDKGDKGDTGAQGERGSDGHTPVKGVDYFTDADIADVTAKVEEAVKPELEEIRAIADSSNETATNAEKQVSEVKDELTQVVNTYVPGIVATAEGSTILIEDSADKPLQGLNLYGKTTQRTTTGAQLCNFRNISITTNGVTVTFDSDGVGIATGTPPEDLTGYLFGAFGKLVDLSLLEIGKKYKSNEQIRCVKDGKYVYENPFVFSESITEVRVYWQVITDSYTDGMTSSPMLNEGTTVLPWEPYTGGAPSPSPEYPQQLVSLAEDGDITVEISGDGDDSTQSATFLCPTGLPGIPVNENGNYTDSDGQQWVCDEIDLENGEYIKRCATLGTKDLQIKYSASDGIYFIQDINALAPDVSKRKAIVNITNKYEASWNGNSTHYFLQKAGQKIVIILNATDYPTEESTKALLNAGITVLYPLLEPQRIKMSDEEIEAYRALHTNYPTTTVTNNADAHTAVTYVADTKNYIDKKLESLTQALLSTGGNV
jgi:hypothetical protein